MAQARQSRSSDARRASFRGCSIHADTFLSTLRWPSSEACERILLHKTTSQLKQKKPAYEVELWQSTRHSISSKAKCCHVSYLSEFDVSTRDQFPSWRLGSGHARINAVRCTVGLHERAVSLALLGARGVGGVYLFVGIMTRTSVLSPSNCCAAGAARLASIGCVASRCFPFGGKPRGVVEYEHPRDSFVGNRASGEIDRSRTRATII
jgi:hypothetical protein